MGKILIMLEEKLKHFFKDKSLLNRAVTHRSFSSDHNERLEFLGDSVLSLAVSSLIFSKLSSLNEGDLSRVRANLVKQETLHRLALDLGIPNVLKLGEGESKSGGHARPSILADALEALIGAVYLDAGYPAAEALVHRLFQGLDIQPQMQAVAKDAKTALQEWLQGKKMNVPRYVVAEITGAAHLQHFKVECCIEALNLKTFGVGAARRSAEQAAAVEMLALLKARK